MRWADLSRIASNLVVRQRDRSGSLAPEGLKERLRERLERSEERRLLALARSGRDVCWTDEREPLVTVRIATYNRRQVVAERAIAAALRQTYERIEVLVVGDRCDGATEAAVRSVSDPRVRFLNLPARGLYPESPRQRWMVAGATPMNVGNVLARGEWIAPCDDDDEFTADHVEVLLRAARARRVEMVYSRARVEVAPGEWREVGSEPLAFGRISHGSVLYAAGLRFMRYSTSCWKLGEPADWNLWKRMRAADVKIGFVDRTTYIHYLETPVRSK